jgi:hypothetical protein
VKHYDVPFIDVCPDGLPSIPQSQGSRSSMMKTTVLTTCLCFSLLPKPALHQKSGRR